MIIELIGKMAGKYLAGLDPDHCNLCRVDIFLAVCIRRHRKNFRGPVSIVPWSALPAGSFGCDGHPRAVSCASSFPKVEIVSQTGSVVLMIHGKLKPVENHHSRDIMIAALS